MQNIGLIVWRTNSKIPKQHHVVSYHSNLISLCWTKIWKYVFWMSTKFYILTKILNSAYLHVVLLVMWVDQVMPFLQCFVRTSTSYAVLRTAPVALTPTGWRRIAYGSCCVLRTAPPVGVAPKIKRSVI